MKLHDVVIYKITVLVPISSVFFPAHSMTLSTSELTGLYAQIIVCIRLPSFPCVPGCLDVYVTILKPQNGFCEIWYWGTFTKIADSSFG